MNEVLTNVSDNDAASMDVRHLFNLYYLRLCYFAHKLINNREAAQDIAQDAFVAFWKKKADFNNELSAKNFLYLTVKNACLNIIRHQEVAKRYIQSQDASELEEEKISQNIIRAELAGEIHAAITSLPKGCGQVLTLAYFEGLKNDEIASQLGISINTVKTQKARAIQLLRLKLDVGALLLVIAVTSF